MSRYVIVTKRESRKFDDRSKAQDFFNAYYSSMKMLFSGLSDVDRAKEIFSILRVIENHSDNTYTHITNEFLKSSNTNYSAFDMIYALKQRIK